MGTGMATYMCEHWESGLCQLMVLDTSFLHIYRFLDADVNISVAGTPVTAFEDYIGG